VSRLGEAIALAAEVHAAQLDKADAPYILHALAVMEGCRPHGNDAMIVGVLHDVLEDCDPLRAVELSDTILNTFGARVHGAVIALTKERGEPYESYIESVAGVYLARLAKTEDLKHNMVPAGYLPIRSWIRTSSAGRSTARL